MKLYVNTPKGRGLFQREYIFSGRRWITVRFYPPQHIKNSRGKKMTNPNAGKYWEHSFLDSLCIKEKGRNPLVLLYNKLISLLNKS